MRLLLLFSIVATAALTGCSSNSTVIEHGSTLQHSAPAPVVVY